MADNVPVEQMSEKQLWVQIGRELTRGEDHALPLDPRELRDRAKSWFSGIEEELANRICTPAVRKFLDGGDTPALIAAIADLISAWCIGVSPITVAYLLMRKGLHTFCANKWSN